MQCQYVLYPHSMVLCEYQLKYSDEPLTEHPRREELEVRLDAVVSLSPRARAAASHAAAVSMYFSHVPNDRRESATPRCPAVHDGTHSLKSTLPAAAVLVPVRQASHDSAFA